MKIYAIEFVNEGYHSKAFSKRENVILEILTKYCEEILPHMAKDLSHNEEYKIDQIKEDLMNLIKNNYIDEYAYVDELEVEDME